MQVKTRKIYYCDYCHIHKHFSSAMAEHEKHCTMNPNRECRMCERKGLPKETITSIKRAYKTLLSHREKGDIWNGINGKYVANFDKRINKLYEELGCPACMLAILRQHQGDWQNNWDYKKAVDEYWAKRNEEEQRNAEYEAMYGI